MFETVVPEIAGRRSRKVFYESLPFSVGAHGLVVGALLTGQIWTIDFPSQSPKLFATYNLVEPTPPPPPPPPPPVIRSAAPVAPVAVPPQLRNLAPTIIPDMVPVVLQEQPPVVQVVGPDNDAVAVSDMSGVEGGIIGGTIASVIPAEPEPPPQRDVVVIERDDPLPVQAIYQDFPAYPEHARTRGWEDSLVVRYVIGRDGRVREVTTLRPPAVKMFEDEAHKKIRQWRFTPFIEHGEAKEVVHELTVEFKIVRPTRR
ncbi:MAG TPA: TonB family protein [Thermoanaerobaculia bacterium]|jgi:protein TonB